MSVWLAGVNIRVIDPFTIKPLDAATIVASARATQGKVITVEDHYKEGMQFPGLGVIVLWPGFFWLWRSTSSNFQECVLPLSFFPSLLLCYEAVLVMFVMTV